MCEINAPRTYTSYRYSTNVRKDYQCNFIAFCSSALRIKLLTKFLKLLLQLSNVIFSFRNPSFIEVCAYETPMFN